jgi:hypothetical protein
MSVCESVIGSTRSKIGGQTLELNQGYQVVPDRRVFSPPSGQRHNEMARKRAQPNVGFNVNSALASCILNPSLAGHPFLARE